MVHLSVCRKRVSLVYEEGEGEITLERAILL